MSLKLHSQIKLLAYLDRMTRMTVLPEQLYNISAAILSLEYATKISPFYT